MLCTDRSSQYGITEVPIKTNVFLVKFIFLGLFLLPLSFHFVVAFNCQLKAKAKSLLCLFIFTFMYSFIASSLMWSLLGFHRPELALSCTFDLW